MTRSRNVWRPTAALASAGAAAFWVVNFAISLTPLAAEYRTALSIAYTPMLVEAAIGGLLIAVLVSWVLLRFPDRVPGRNPIVQSLLICLVVLLAVTALIEVPAKSLTSSTDDPWRYFVIGAAFNALRILALGVAVGYVWDRRTGSADPRAV